MKIVFFAFFLVVSSVLSFTACNSNFGTSQKLNITYPIDGAVFPADITVPSVVWTDSSAKADNWIVTVVVDNTELISKETDVNNWRASVTEWEDIKSKALGKQVQIFVEGKKASSKSGVTITISEDKVEAPIFFRSVPLPFKFARENLKRVRWHLGSISETSKPHVMLDNIPVCANCHSFSPNGKTVAMDVDARDDKGAYVITEFNKNTSFHEDSIIHWSDYQEGKFTYGLLSQISPNGRYVVSTLRDCEIFADRKNLEYSQLFFPFKGILVVYDRLKETYFELEGANDTMLVQSNPCWTPDGEYIYFARARAKHYEESGIHNGSVPRKEDISKYQTFEKKYFKRDSLIKFDICKIPFNNGEGGEAIPIKGASQNGMSNYFPKISPDGKWFVFCQAESFMLLQKDSKLNILPIEGGEPREMTCNTGNMNSWHSWSPNGKWLVFSSKEYSPYTQLFLTHINADGTDSPPVYLENFSFDQYAANIPEFVNIEYDKDLKIEPTFLSENDFLIRNGEIKAKQGNIEGAFIDFNNAVKQFPDESEPYYQRGRMYFEKTNYTAAINDFNRAISIKKEAGYYTSRGITYTKMNETRKAIADLNTSCTMDSESFTPWVFLGVTYAQREDYLKAIDCLQKAVGLFDRDAYPFYYLGYAYYSTRNWKKANDALTKATKLGPQMMYKPLIYELRARTLMNLGDYSGVVGDALVAIDLSPGDPDPYMLKGRAELKMGLKADALKSFNKAKSLGAAEAEVYIRQNS